MELDRGLIKQQSKQLIKGKVFILFIIIFVVSLLTNSNNILSSVRSAEYKNIFNSPSISRLLPKNGQSEDDYARDLEDYLEEFGGSVESETAPRTPKNVFLSLISRILYFANIILSPLEILLFGLFLLLVHGKRLELADEFEYVFKNTFSKDYFDKLLLVILSRLFTILWCLLFIVPGIIYYYKIYFAFFISAENPNLTWKDALDISKKMTNNHKGELFVFDLSFIPWWILTGISFGVVGIYALPYYYTARALYYENFKQRAFMTGELTQADFMSEAEKYAQFVQTQGGNAQQNFYPTQPPVQQYTQYQTPYNGYNANAQPYNDNSKTTVINPPVSPVQPAAPQSADSFYQPTPPQAETPASPQNVTEEIPTTEVFHVAEEVPAAEPAPVVEEAPIVEPTEE